MVGQHDVLIAVAIADGETKPLMCLGHVVLLGIDGVGEIFSGIGSREARI